MYSHCHSTLRKLCVALQKKYSNATDSFQKTPAPWSPEEEQYQHTQRNKTRQNNAIPPPLRPNPIDQPINPRHLTRRPNNPTINTRQRLPLHAKRLVHGIGLAEHTIHHVVAVVDAAALLQHVLGLGFSGVGAAVGVDVGAHVGEEVLAVAGLGDAGLEAFELAFVVEEHFAVAGEVVLLEGGGG
jgi:hypothetical protein